MSSGTLDALVHDLTREVARECADAVRSDLRQVLAGELAKISMASAPGIPEYVSVKAAAKIGGVHESTIRGWIKAGKLKAYQPEPRILRVRVDELHAVMAGSVSNGDGEVIAFTDKVRALTARAAKAGSKK